MTSAAQKSTAASAAQEFDFAIRDKRTPDGQPFVIWGLMEKDARGKIIKDQSPVLVCAAKDADTARKEYAAWSRGFEINGDVRDGAAALRQFKFGT